MKDVVVTRQLFVALIMISLVRMNICDTEEVAKVSGYLDILSNKLFIEIASKNTNENVIISPFSIQICGAMLRSGAEGETREEIDRGLQLVLSDRNEVVESYSTLLASYESSPLISIANKIYVMRDYQMQDNFNRILKDNFFASAEQINFSNQEAAAYTINKWIESNTNNKIKDVIKSEDLNSDTRLILVNAIYFKGEWEYGFSKSLTKLGVFHLNNGAQIQVPMMQQMEMLPYGYIPVLDASAVELPYKNSDLSMLIILPNSNIGLRKMEENMKSINISELRLETRNIHLRLPKFKIEFEVDLKIPFLQLGMKKMFSLSAEFDNMLKNGEDLTVSAIQHKVFIDVNEVGTEATAATGITMIGRSGSSSQILFHVDRPFLYSIRNKNGIQLFTGHIVKLP